MGSRLYALAKPSILPVEAFLSDLEGRPKLLTVLYGDPLANRFASRILGMQRNRSDMLSEFHSEVSTIML